MPRRYKPRTLDDVDAALKRWRPRLTRAANEVAKLLKMRHRIVHHEPKLMATSPVETFVARGVIAQKAVDEIIAADKVRKDADELTIPADLRVTADVEKLRAERRKKEEAERHKMPLTGRAAMDHIKRRKK